MKVLIVTPNYPVPDNREAGIFVHRQVANLVRQGLDCHVLTYRPAPPPFPLWLRRRTWLRYYWHSLRWADVLDGVRINQIFYRKPSTPGADVVPSIGKALVEFVERNPEYLNTDVVYSHWLWTGGAAALHLRRRFGWPVVAIARGSEMHSWHKIQPHCRPHVKGVLREADRVLANCQYLRNCAEEFLPGIASRIGVVYNGCDAEFFNDRGDKAEARKRLGLDARAKYLLFCGVIEDHKGLKELAGAWGLFSKGHPEWKLILVGRVLNRQLEQALRACGGVTFTGQIPQTEVLTYLQSADAYVQPSRLEGLANATMEAMAVGLPVVTTDTCGQAELIRDGENGRLVPPSEPDALYRALKGLADYPVEAQRMGVAARRTIETKFNPQSEAEKLCCILAEAAGRRACEREVGCSGAASATR